MSSIKVSFERVSGRGMDMRLLYGVAVGRLGGVAAVVSGGERRALEDLERLPFTWSVLKKRANFIWLGDDRVLTARFLCLVGRRWRGVSPASLVVDPTASTAAADAFGGVYALLRI